MNHIQVCLLSENYVMYSRLGDRGKEHVAKALKALGIRTQIPIEQPEWQVILSAKGYAIKLSYAHPGRAVV